MLVDCRQEDFCYSVPKLDIGPSEVEGFMKELRAFHELYTPCFLRSETREHVFRYLVGRFSKLERKSMEPIALNVENGVVRSLQRAISETKWDEELMLSIHRAQVFTKRRVILSRDGLACPGRPCGWSCGARWDRSRTTAFLSATRRARLACRPLFGSAACAGPSNSASRREKANWAWIITRCAVTPAGATIC